MPTLIPALRADMGNRTYFIGKMRAQTISQHVSVAAELEEWDHLSIEELYQRDLNRNRVLKEIAPYLTNTVDRFFGAIIVLIKDASTIAFEPIGSFDKKVPASYARAADDIGFLTIGLKGDGTHSGGLVALDGQHRLAALRAVVQGQKVDGQFASDVADDEVTVIFVEHVSDASSRRLFTTLNRSARKTSKHDNLVMDEDDARCIVARRIAASELFAPRGLEYNSLIKWDSNTMGPSDEAITTLNAMFEVVGTVADAEKVPVALKRAWTERPSDDELTTLQEFTTEWIEQVFQAFPELRTLIDNPDAIPAAREPSALLSLVLKPAGFVVLFRAIAVASNPLNGGLTDLAEAVTRVAALDWSIEAPLWSGVLIKPNGTISGRTGEWDLAADLAVWMACSDSCDPAFVEQLRSRYRKHTGISDSDLPDPEGQQ